MSRSPRTGALLLWSFDGEVSAGGAVFRRRASAAGSSAPRLVLENGLPRGRFLAQGAVGVEAWCPRRPRSENPLPAALRTTTTTLRPPQRLAAALVSCRPHPLTRRRRHSARSSVGPMGLFSHEKFRDPDEGVAGGASGGAVERARGADVDEFGSDHPVVVGPGLPPEDGSCGQFAVQFHVSTSMLVGLKRIADIRGVSVPEVCRQVVGVFVAQQEGELGALLAAEAEVADYRPSLGDA